MAIVKCCQFNSAVTFIWQMPFLFVLNWNKFFIDFDKNIVVCWEYFKFKCKYCCQIQNKMLNSRVRHRSKRVYHIHTKKLLSISGSRIMTRPINFDHNIKTCTWLHASKVWNNCKFPFYAIFVLSIFNSIKSCKQTSLLFYLSCLLLAFFNTWMKRNGYFMINHLLFISSYW